LESAFLAAHAHNSSFFNSKRVMTYVFKVEFALNGIDRSIS